LSKFSYRLEDLVEKSDLLTSHGELQSLLSREESILSAKSKRELELMMNFSVNNPIDTAKVKAFIHRKKDEELSMNVGSILSGLTRSNAFQSDDLSRVDFHPETESSKTIEASPIEISPIKKVLPSLVKKGAILRI